MNEPMTIEREKRGGSSGAAPGSAIPRATPVEVACGWTLQYNTLSAICDSVNSRSDNGGITLEDTELVIVELAKRGYAAISPN